MQFFYSISVLSPVRPFILLARQAAIWDVLGMSVDIGVCTIVMHDAPACGLPNANYASAYHNVALPGRGCKDGVNDPFLFDENLQQPDIGRLRPSLAP